MVADAVLYDPRVSHWLKFVSTTVGRDKLLRTIQYFSRFYAWYLLRSNASKSEIAPWSKLKSTLGLARKAFRLGKFIEHFRAAAKAYDLKAASSSEALIQYLTMGRQLGYAGYMLLDSMTFLDAAGVYKTARAKTWQKEAYRCWFWGIACSVVMGAWKNVQLGRRENEVNRSQGEGAVELKMIQKERTTVNTQLLQDLCDITSPGMALGYGQGYLDDGIVGLAGTLSSLLGLTNQWRKTA